MCVVTIDCMVVTRSCDVLVSPGISVCKQEYEEHIIRTFVNTKILKHTYGHCAGFRTFCNAQNDSDCFCHPSDSSLHLSSFSLHVSYHYILLYSCFFSTSPHFMFLCISQSIIFPCLLSLFLYDAHLSTVMFLLSLHLPSISSHLCSVSFLFL